jgi:hypothetical protein
MAIKFNDIETIYSHLSFAEDENIKEIMKTMPPLSYVTFINNDDEYDNGGFLLSNHKTYFKLIRNVNDMDSIIKVKYSNIKKIFYVFNARTYRWIYTNNNREKKRERNRRYREKKKMLKEQVKLKS